MQYSLDLSQRWRDRTPRFVPPDTRIDTREFGIDVISREAAKKFLERVHYLQTTPVSMLCVGLFRKTGVAPAALTGVAVFGTLSTPSPPPALHSIGVTAKLELTRFALMDEAAFNAETYFGALARKALATHRPDDDVVLARSDPHPRVDANGTVVFGGHVGQIYAAGSASYIGRGAPRKVYVCRDGTILPDRNFSKIRHSRPGWSAAAERLIAAGAPPREFGEHPSDWLTRALRSPVFRTEQHPGVHTYVFPLRRATGRHLKAHLATLPYPKKQLA